MGIPEKKKKNTSKPKPFGFGVTPAQKTLPESGAQVSGLDPHRR